MIVHGLGDILRLTTIFLAFIAMWALWDARRKRRYLWTEKMRGIWLVQIGWTFAAAEANIELYYRHARPSVAIFLVIFLLVLSIKTALMSGKYTIDQTDD